MIMDLEEMVTQQGIIASKMGRSKRVRVVRFLNASMEKKLKLYAYESLLQHVFPSKQKLGTLKIPAVMDVGAWGWGTGGTYPPLFHKVVRKVPLFSLHSTLFCLGGCPLDACAPYPLFECFLRPCLQYLLPVHIKEKLVHVLFRIIRN